jgi:hypothetical protein
VTRATPEPDDAVVMQAFREIRRAPALQRYFLRIAARPPVSSGRNFAEWNAKQVGRVQPLNIAGRKEVFDLGYLNSWWLKSGSFVKREFTWVDFFEKPGGADPRSIITFTPQLHAIYGPMTYVCQRELVLAMREDDGRLGALINSEATAEELGAWVEEWTERLTINGRPPYYVTGDGSRYDAHVRAVHLDQAKRTKFQGVRLNDIEEQAATHLRHVSGRSRHGVRFVATDVMGSGDDATNLDDTIINWADQQHALNGVIGLSMALAGGGDDMFAIVAAHVVEGDPRTPYSEQCHQRSLAFGFVYDYQVSQDLWRHDFCSKLAYPTPDGLVFGPKIGRALGRAGWHLDWSNDGNQTLRSMAIGLLDDSWHVPFLREYFQRVLELAEGPLGGRPPHGIHVSRRHEYSDDTWDFVERRYGVTPADLDHFKALLSQVTRLPAVVDFPPFRDMWDIDLA